MLPDWTSLPQELLRRIGRTVMLQAGPGTHQLRKAVHFASVCQDFRAAAHAPGFWRPVPQLRLLWVLAGSAVSSLLSAWAPCFESVILIGACDGCKPGASLALRYLTVNVHRLSINVASSQRQGDSQVLASCLTLAYKFDAEQLRVVCDAMSPADVQLLAGLRPPAFLLMICDSPFTLYAFLATGNTRVILKGAHPGRPAPNTPFHVSWQAMTAACVSTFYFGSACVVVHHYTAQPLPVSVRVEMDNLNSVQGLPFEAMRASRDGWQVKENTFDDEIFVKGP